ncbi:hypothetical protein M0811_08758 [Anaeramoeba ignava]|uniref:Transmembrane protein n=1 Tax=Anaeramoeba ignava TaxID=1746090 RepID=A0A9Q0LK78_ANAIG|nr:hypothetical protein M0811_08758 [Anaeramoeba ignava]|eukprot:Anaeramoba_ignava/a89874_21.p1 GENE.a89874_21~~a89874_21.p1  ORF type:complete len:124 (+),score=16.15 a89874_21:138-509(+)
MNLNFFFLLILLGLTSCFSFETADNTTLLFYDDESCNQLLFSMNMTEGQCEASTLLAVSSGQGGLKTTVATIIYYYPDSQDCTGNSIITNVQPGQCYKESEIEAGSIQTFTFFFLFSLLLFFF